MRTFAKLFGPSPFVPLQSHMDKVVDCVDALTDIFKAFQDQDFDRVEKLADEISQLEHEADQVKHDIQDHMPRRMFLAVDRTRLLEILSTQDSIADKCENVAIQLTLKRLKMLHPLKDNFTKFLNKNIEAFRGAHAVIKQLDELLESSFGGPEAEKVKHMVAEVSYKEHEADLIQRDLVKQLYAQDEHLSGGTFYLWSQIIRQLNELSNLSERLANRVRVTLELK